MSKFYLLEHKNKNKKIKDETHVIFNKFIEKKKYINLKPSIIFVQIQFPNSFIFLNKRQENLSNRGLCLMYVCT
jgi:hypothetical protein